VYIEGSEPVALMTSNRNFLILADRASTINSSKLFVLRLDVENPAAAIFLSSMFLRITTSASMRNWGPLAAPLIMYCWGTPLSRRKVTNACVTLLVLINMLICWSSVRPDDCGSNDSELVRRGSGPGVVGGIKRGDVIVIACGVGRVEDRYDALELVIPASLCNVERVNPAPPLSSLLLPLLELELSALRGERGGGSAIGLAPNCEGRDLDKGRDLGDKGRALGYKGELLTDILSSGPLK
jgi:hypothetical protein